MDKKSIIFTIYSIIVSLVIGYTVGVNSKNKLSMEQGIDKYTEYMVGTSEKEKDEKSDRIIIVEAKDDEATINKILKQKPHVKENYNRDDEIKTDIDLLTKMFLKENEYLYNLFLSQYLEDIDCSLNIENIDVVMDGTVATYKIDIANTDASCWFERDTAIEEADGNWYLPPANKYGSDYRIIYFTNGVPSNSKDIYAKVYDEMGVGIGGVTDYREGDKSIRIDSASGNFVIIDLDN